MSTDIRAASGSEPAVHVGESWEPVPLRPAHAAPPLSDEDAAVIRAWFPLAASPAAAEAEEAA